jgi:hypothetical protein
MKVVAATHSAVDEIGVDHEWDNNDLTSSHGCRLTVGSHLHGTVFHTSWLEQHNNTFCCSLNTYIMNCVRHILPVFRLISATFLMFWTMMRLLLPSEKTQLIEEYDFCQNTEVIARRFRDKSTLT